MISLAASWSAGSGNGSKPPAWTCGSRSGRASWPWAPQGKIVYDKFHSMQHANAAIEEVRKAEFFRPGPKQRGLIQGKKWWLLSRWKNLTLPPRGELNRLFQLHRRVFQAYLLKESLERLWNYRYRGPCSTAGTSG
jgi:hypothetical protein